MQRERQNNIELCRVCVMLFIVIHHCIVSGLGLNETLNDGGENFSSATICLIVMNAFVIVSVNVFFLISGYFGIKLRTQKIKKLLEEVLFYSVAIYAVCVLLGVEKLTLKNILKYTILSINNPCCGKGCVHGCRGWRGGKAPAQHRQAEYRVL